MPLLSLAEVYRRYPRLQTHRFRNAAQRRRVILALRRGQSVPGFRRRRYNRGFGIVRSDRNEAIRLARQLPSYLQEEIISYLPRRPRISGAITRDIPDPNAIYRSLPAPRLRGPNGSY